MFTVKYGVIMSLEDAIAFDNQRVNPIDVSISNIRIGV